MSRTFPAGPRRTLLPAVSRFKVYLVLLHAFMQQSRRGYQPHISAVEIKNRALARNKS